MTSLKTLLSLKPRVLYPAHGPHIVSQPKVAEHLQAYITHRQDREDQILSLLETISKEGGLEGLMKDYFERQKVIEEKKIKDLHEFHSGLEYVPPKPTASEEAAKGDKDGKKEATKPAPRIGDDMPIHPQTPQPKRIKFLEALPDTKPPGEGFVGRHTEFTQKATPLELLTRLIYNTSDEKLIFAAKKPTLAHLEKLEKDGKVRQVQGEWRGLVDMKIGEVEAGEGWEAVPLAAQQLEAGEKEVGVEGDVGRAVKAA